MKKSVKFLAVILSAVLAISVCISSALPANAEESRGIKRIFKAWVISQNTPTDNM